MAPTADPASGSRVAKNTAFLTFALIGQKILSSLYYFVIIAAVGPSSAGDYLSATAFVNLFANLIDLGLTSAFIRQIARDEQQAKRQLHAIVTFKLFTSLLVTGLLFGAVFWLRHASRLDEALNVPNIKYLWWAAGSMVIDSVTMTAYAYFRGIQRFEYESVGTIVHRVTVMIVGITGVTMHASPRITIIAVVAGSIANFLYATLHLWRRGLFWRWNWNTPFIRQLLKISLPFAVANFLIAIYAQTDTVLLTIFAKPRVVGIYGFALKGLIMFQILPTALAGALYPAMSAAFISNRDRLARLFGRAEEYLIILVVPATICILLLAHEVILVFGRSQVWIDATWPLRVLAIGLPFLFFNFPVGYLLNATNQERRNMQNIAITVVINVILNLFFIRKYTYHSVAIFSSLGTILLFFLNMRYVHRTIAVPYRQLWRTFLRVLLAGLVMAAAGWELLPIAKGAIGIVKVGVILGTIYIALLLAMRVLRLQDLARFIRRFRT